MTDDAQLLAKLIDVVEKLEHTAAGILLEVRGGRVHADSSGYFLQVAAEDLLEAVRELKQLVVQK